MGKFKLKGKGEKYKVKAAKQLIALEPADLMNGEEGNQLYFCLKYLIEPECKILEFDCHFDCHWLITHQLFAKRTAVWNFSALQLSWVIQSLK